MGYFYSVCSSYNDIINNNGSVVENKDGTVSVYKSSFISPSGYAPLPLTKYCCEKLKVGYFFDLDSQECKWSTKSTDCSLDSFKLTLNPIGNDGNLFFIDSNVDNTEKCSLNIEFDYIFKVSCESLTNILYNNEAVITNANTCLTPIDVLENLDVSVLLEYVDSSNNLVTVATYPLFTSIGAGKLYDYLNTTTDSGFLVCGEPNAKEKSKGITGCTPIYLESNSSKNVSVCDVLITNIVNGLLAESTLDKITFDNSFNKNSLASKWLHYQTTISDETILAKITNKKIKLTIQVNSSCGEFCILLDNIQLNRDCSLVTENKMFISTPPNFNLTRVIDNKKSWVANTTPENRPFHISNALGGSDIRQTNYNVNDERLVINTKEIDLDMDIASAIETDVFCYVNDNPCLLTATTLPNNCSCPKVGCFKDYFTIEDYKVSALTHDLEDRYGAMRAQRDNWYKAFNERWLAVGPYYTIKDSPYSKISNPDMQDTYYAVRDAYEKANRELGYASTSYIYYFNNDQGWFPAPPVSYYQYVDEPLPRILKTDCGNVLSVIGDHVVYFLSNELDELEVYVQNVEGLVQSPYIFTNYTSLLNEGNADGSFIGIPKLPPQEFCTQFSRFANQYTATIRGSVNSKVNSNVFTKTNGNAYNNDNSLFFAGWDSDKNKCMARNKKVIPEAFSLNYLKQDYVRWCKYYSGRLHPLDVELCIKNATSDYKYGVTLITTVTGDTLYLSGGNYVITNISDTSLIPVGSYVNGDGITYTSQVISVGINSITIDKICTLTLTGVTIEILDMPYNDLEGKNIFYRAFRDGYSKRNNESLLASGIEYLTAVEDINGNIPYEYPSPGCGGPNSYCYTYIPVDVTTTIRKGSVDGPIAYQESYRLNDPSSLSSVGLAKNPGLAALEIPIGVAYSGGSNNTSDPFYDSSYGNSKYINTVYGTHITGTTSGMPFIRSGYNTVGAMDFKDEYYVHIDIVDTSGNTYYATNNDFNLRHSNSLIKFPTSASTQTFDINSLIASIDYKKQEFIDARDYALHLIVKNGHFVNG